MDSMNAYFVAAVQHPALLLVEPDKFLLAALLQSWRFIADSRDEATEERLDDLEDAFV